MICIGPKNVGKTLLLRYLLHSEKHFSSYDTFFATVPTVGVNIARIPLVKDKVLLISELGGTMAPIWPMHYKDCKGVLYIIDAVNLQQISCAAILLMEALKNPDLKNSKFAVILNKVDMTRSLSDIKHLIRYEDICSNATQEITMFETSCITGKGIKDVKAWLQNRFTDSSI